MGHDQPACSLSLRERGLCLWARIRAPPPLRPPTFYGGVFVHPQASAGPLPGKEAVGLSMCPLLSGDLRAESELPRGSCPLFLGLFCPPTVGTCLWAHVSEPRDQTRGD